jgi:hypothetical protein
MNRREQLVVAVILAVAMLASMVFFWLMGVPLDR